MPEDALPRFSLALSLIDLEPKLAPVSLRDESQYISMLLRTLDQLYDP